MVSSEFSTGISYAKQRKKDPPPGGRSHKKERSRDISGLDLCRMWQKPVSYKKDALEKQRQEADRVPEASQSLDPTISAVHLHLVLPMVWLILPSVL